MEILSLFKPHLHQPTWYKLSSCLLTWLSTKLGCCTRLATLTDFTGVNTFVIRVYYNFLQFLSYEHCHCAIHNIRIGTSTTVAIAGWLLHVVQLLFRALRWLLHIVQLLFIATDLMAMLCTVAVHTTEVLPNNLELIHTIYGKFLSGKTLWSQWRMVVHEKSFAVVCLQTHIVSWQGYMLYKAASNDLQENVWGWVKIMKTTKMFPLKNFVIYSICANNIMN